MRNITTVLRAVLVVAGLTGAVVGCDGGGDGGGGSPAPEVGGGTRPGPAPTPGESGEPDGSGSGRGEGDANPEAGGGTAESESPRAGRTAAECDSLWSQAIALYVPGLEKEYETSTVVTDPPATTFSMRSRSREKVTQVTDQGITSSYWTQTLEPELTPEQEYVTTLTRAQFLEACESPTGDASVPDDGDYAVEIVEQGRRRVTVRAGTFEADYTKMRVTGSMEGQTYEAIHESWVSTDAAGFAIKSTSTTKTTTPEGESTNERVMELTKLTRP